MTVTNPAQTGSSAEPGSTTSVRLHYLDWLRVVATLGVFLFHTTRPFDLIDWVVNNTDQSVAVNAFFMFVIFWGMPLFFLLSGAGSRFALRRRTGRQYLAERVQRLLIPFVVGCLLLTPIQLYLEWKQRVQRGLYVGTLWEFLLSRKVPFGPLLFSRAGYHLWFVGFLFVFSLIALPLFLWLKKDAGKRFISWLAVLSERRGAILLAILPLALIRVILHGRFPGYTDWSDFAFMLAFFVSGYILYADEQFVGVIRRERRLVLAVGIIVILVVYALFLTGLGDTWMASPGTPGFYLFAILLSAVSWCWVMIMLNVGMRFLDFRNKWLEFGQEAMLPFYMFHHAVIAAIAFFVVQWQTGIPVKLAVVALGSFVVTLGLTEAIRRIGPLRSLFGMKTRHRQMPTT